MTPKHLIGGEAFENLNPADTHDMVGVKFDFWFAHHSPMTEEVRSCARENLLRSPALSLALRDLAACEQFQLP